MIQPLTANFFFLLDLIIKQNFKKQLILNTFDIWYGIKHHILNMNITFKDVKGEKNQRL